MSKLRAFPGTHVYNVACERGIIKDRVQFLKDGCPPVNITKMTDDEYHMLPVLIDLHAAKSKLEEARAVPQDGCTVGVTGRCPHCANEISCECVRLLFDDTPVTCPSCRKEVIITAIEYCDFDKMNQNAAKLLDGTGAAVWGINAHNYHWLLQAMPALRAENVRFVNKGEIVVPHNGCVVKTLEGKAVHTPDIIARDGIDTVIVPNNPEVFKAIREQCEAEYPMVKQVVHITELM